MDAKVLENAILSLGRDTALLARFRADPAGVGAELGLDAEWAAVIADGRRDRLRSAGVVDGITILVSRWFADDLGDSTSSSRFHVEASAPLPDPDVPENLVFAGGCSHVPDLLARPEIDPADAVERLTDGYRRLAERLAAADPEVLLVTADCHFQSFRTGAFVIGTGASHTGSMEFFKRPDLDLTLTGDPEFAQAMVDAVRAEGMEVEESDRIDLDHGLIVPLRQLLPRPDLPVIPIITQPARSFSPFGARAFGQVLRTVVESRGRRVAMLATGGLSHWLDPGRFGGVDVEFDTYILEMLQAGRGNDLGNLEPYPLLDHGQYEFLNWLIMLGLAGPGVRGEVLAYEPMEASGGGWTVVDLPLPDRAPRDEGGRACLTGR
ncbi:Aromatic ring-opening dioxygenase, catalytic subunit, LigB family [Thermomonospora echinospora]|uniref:Aromatic ring-opening dioxygenase, catalytic subunit, LigB family n=1 Tax=Thermomonospora echinospora TaxID=1992 RepID=A0A1H6DU31_9ACTN|nr:protocatechuate 3,4-dioxygenase [Thermomonospora echinospora]SEG88791.1 Aromatic ring-opening dioxygenase, catalytic subunit, LigB family [Thermomonospora echinospora]